MICWARDSRKKFKSTESRRKGIFTAYVRTGIIPDPLLGRHTFYSEVKKAREERMAEKWGRKRKRKSSKEKAEAFKRFIGKGGIYWFSSPL